MTIYKYTDNEITQLVQTTFVEERIKEVPNLQELFIKHINAIEEGLLIIANEFGDWEDSKRKIDILCIDKSANLVVVELKRTEDGGHMELQSIRYAAMVSQMTFDKAVEIYQRFIEHNDLSVANAKAGLLDFLGWDEPQKDDFANDVRIILVSSNFSKEITTSVLWLIQRDLDVKCIRVIPYKDGGNLYLDILQMIPLPETSEYQIQLKQKVQEQRQARNQRDNTKYIFNDKTYPKNRLVLAIIKRHVELNPNISFDELLKAFPKRLQGSYGVFTTLQEAENIIKKAKNNRKHHFLAPDELIELGEVTIAVCVEWGIGNIGKFIEAAQHLDYKINPS